eukprot:jgi/Tetstr1/436227/TSEL_025072.t1
MDPKRDFRLPGAAARASEAKQFGISVATLKTLYKREWEDGTGGGAAPTCSQHGRAARTNPRYPNHDGTRFLDMSSDEDEDVVGSGSEWEYEGTDEEDDLELSPTTGRILTAPERLVKHGTVACGAAYCLPCLAEAEAFNITDVDGGQSTGLLYKIPAGTLCRPCKHDAISRCIPQDVEAEMTVVRYKVFQGLVGAKGGISGKYSEWRVTGVGVLEALAYREGMKEYEPSSASSTLRGFVINSCEELERFLGLADFSSRCFGQFFFVAHEEVTPEATPAGSPTPRQPDGRKPRRADGTVGKYGGVSNKESPSMLRDVSMLRAAQTRLEREQRKGVREGKKMLADRKAAARR